MRRPSDVEVRQRSQECTPRRAVSARPKGHSGHPCIDGHPEARADERQEGVPQPHAIVALVPVGRVIMDRQDPAAFRRALDEPLMEISPGEGEERTHQTQRTAVRNPGQAGHTAPPQHPIQHGLDLVIPVVCGHEVRGTGLPLQAS